MSAWCVCQNCGPTRSLYRVERDKQPEIVAFIHARSAEEAKTLLASRAPYFKPGKVTSLVEVTR